MIGHTAAKELYGDLIGIPFKAGGRSKRGIDCAGVASEILRRLGVEVPDDAWTPGAMLRDDWERLGDCYLDAREVGDVIASDPGAIGAATHVSVVVDTKGFLVLTSDKTMGVVASKAYAIHNVLGAYRWRRAT